MKEYVTTLKKFEDLDSFYEDMETPGGTVYIPDRSVDVANRRSISVNTHYYLTEEEAEQIRNDPRVEACELTPTELGLKVIPHWTQTSSFWDKSSANNSNHRNWGLLRCVEGAQRSNWGDDSILTTKAVSGSISVNSEGRNVDVVIIDGFINPNHPEFAVNSDGSGGSRVVQYNWLLHSAIPSRNYIYGPYIGTSIQDNNEHGIHVAGTVAGNTQGWARSANIYNIYPYGGDPNGLDALFLFDYIRAWHNSKPVNPLTGRKNPTIINNSWGYGAQLDIASITRVNYRGTNYTSNLTSSTLYGNYGIFNDGIDTSTPQRYAGVEADAVSAMNDGIIFVGAAGNDYSKIDVVGGEDYNNYFIWNSFTVYYHRGMAPTAATNHICVGAIGSNSSENKASFSNSGPRINLYAPGRYIISSLNASGVTDSRNSSYRLGKYSGTSMASPQVAGVLACLMEIYPNLTQTEAIDYLIKNSKYNQIPESNGSYNDPNNLQGSANRHLYYYKERADIGTTWPKLNYKPRPSSGRVYPRTKRILK
jgi:subtilisin family serine protease